MVLVENFRIAFSALRANKMRSILTTLGIIIGVAAVIAVVSIVQGLQFMITKQLQGVGATFMVVVARRPSRDAPASWRARSSSPGRTARRSASRCPASS